MALPLIIIQACMDIAMLVVMTFAAIADAKSGVVKPIYQILIFALAVLHLIPVFIWEGWLSGVLHIAAGLLLWIIQWALVAIFKSGISGADFKISGSLALYLSLLPGLIMVLAHGLSALGYVLFHRIKNHKRIASVRLIPFLMVGFVVARIFAWIIAFVK